MGLEIERDAIYLVSVGDEHILDAPLTDERERVVVTAPDAIQQSVTYGTVAKDYANDDYTQVPIASIFLMPTSAGHHPISIERRLGDAVLEAISFVYEAEDPRR